MEKAKCCVSEPLNSVAMVLERLTKEANHERQAIGYPERRGKIIYSNTVRQLAAEAIKHGFSATVIAKAAAVSVQSVEKWSKQKPQSLFRELRIVPVQNPEREVITSDEKRDPPDDTFRSLEFVLPSGVRVLVNRRDLDANLLSLFMSAKGA